MATLSTSNNNPKTTLSILLVVIIAGATSVVPVVESAGTWCVARSDASEQALQTALDYACFAGADCTPLLSNGLCFLPNTIQAHASYAFNSYFQRKGRASDSCDFSGTATIARTDPSYGSCVYPSSQSTAGGSTSTTPTTTNSPTILAPPTSTLPGTTGLNPTGTTPSLPTDNSKATLGFKVARKLMPAMVLLVMLCTM